MKQSTKDIVLHTHSHVHHINIMLSQCVTGLLSLKRLSSHANFNACLGNGFSCMYCLSLSTNISLYLYEYSTEDKLYLLFQKERLTAKTHLFEDTACKITFSVTSSFSICSQYSTLPPEKKGADGGTAATL